MAEKLLGPETESPLGSFCEAAKEYGVEGIEFERHPDGTEVLKQKLGEGWPGLGYDGQNIWLAPTLQTEGIGWNANTVFPEKGVYRDITITEKISGLRVHHPIARLFAGLRERKGVEVHITGAHVDWAIDERTRLVPDEAGNLVGNIPTGVKVKAVITNVEANWDDGGLPGDAWRRGQEQKLTIKPESKWDSEQE